ncbi:MAG: hypothetical protein HRT61_03525 [Ekhidna sp.]|nr:hypothetical protein [Ekhidna sp.]
MKALDDFEEEVRTIAKKIEAPDHLIPTFASSRHDGTPHIEITGKEYHFVVCEQGTEFSRQRTFEKKDILFWIFDSITFSMASKLELAKRRDDEDFRVQLFELQEQLIYQIDPEYAEILHKKHQQLLK